MCWTSHDALSCDPSGAGTGRHLVVGHLEDVRNAVAESDERLDEELVWETGLVTAELLANASQSCESTMSVQLDVHHDHLRVTVYDDGRGAPERRTPRTDETSGRGLNIVESLSTAWGTDSCRPGKCVWAELAIASDSFTHLDCTRTAG